MEKEGFYYLLIYFHALLGGFALFIGALALLVQKGSRPHKKYGKMFFFSMLTSAKLAIVISVLPGHESYFLFTIGLFSSYFLVSGFRSIQFKRYKALPFDKGFPIFLALTGVAMIFLPLWMEGKLNLVMLVFGVFAILFGIRDFRTIRNAKKLRKVWLKMHLGNMIGGYIAAVTAFLVVNEILPGLWSWFVPGILGGVYISYWNKKIDRKHELQKANT